MKRKIVEYVSKCLICQPVKPERRKLSEIFNPFHVPKWKWEHVTKDFLFGLPRLSSGYDEIWMIVDRLTKTYKFLPVKMSFNLDKLVMIYVDKIVSQYGAPVSIVFDRDPGSLLSSCRVSKRA